MRIDRCAQESSSIGANREWIIARILQAQRAVADDPDMAALMLDGVLAQLLVSGSHQAALPRIAKGDALHELESAWPEFAWKVRLALRAPNIEARLAHCWALVRALGPELNVKGRVIASHIDSPGKVNENHVS